MEFEWDEEKNKQNAVKHGISFEQAIQIFNGITLTSLDDRVEYGEVREQTIGSLQGQVTVLVVHMDRNDITRIISARLASRVERRIYNEYCKKITQ